MSRTAYIYGLSGQDGIIRYIGKTMNPQKRFNEHRRGSESRTDRKANWVRSMQSKGDTLQIHILEEHPQENVQDWRDAEEFYIRYFSFLGNKLTNIFVHSLSGIEPTAEARKNLSLVQRMRTDQTKAQIAEKISKSLKGRPMPEEQRQRLAEFHNTDEWKEFMSKVHKGKKLSDEEKLKISQFQTGRKRSQETRAKQSAALKKYKRTPEHIEKIRLAQTGVPRGPMPQATIDKIRAAHLGKKRGPMTPEQKAKLAAGQQAALLLKPRPKTGPMTPAQIENLTMRREATKILKILQSRQLI